MKDRSNHRAIFCLKSLLGNRFLPFATAAILAALVCIPYSEALAGSPVRPRDIPKMLALKGKKLSALKAVMTITTRYHKDDSVQKLKGFLIYRRPLDFRFQGLGPAGNSLFELVFRGISFELFVPSERKLLKGNKECFARRFPDVAEVKGLIPLALLQWRDARYERTVSDKSGTVVIRLSFRGEKWEATVERAGLLVSRLVRLGAGGPDLTADFGDFTSDEYGWLPRRFKLKSRTGRWQTMVKMSRVKTNPFLVEKNFRLETTFSPTVEKCR